MDIKGRIEEITRELPNDVELIAVSKTKKLDEMEIAYKCGLRNFGENKVQELISKYDDFHNDVNWHLIGHLQSNKVKYIVGKVHLIQSLDSIKLLNEIEKVYKKHNEIANTLIQVNIGREQQKYGILEENIYEILKEVEKCSFVRVKGIMVIIPKGTEIDNKFYFNKTYTLWKSIKQQYYKNVSMDILSMGMSSDYEIAIKEGSNMVRIGQGIFGKREYNN